MLLGKARAGKPSQLVSPNIPPFVYDLMFSEFCLLCGGVCPEAALVGVVAPCVPFVDVSVQRVDCVIPLTH